MSSVNSTASCMPKLRLEKKYQSPKTRKQKRATKRKAVTKTRKMKYQKFTQDEVQAAINKLTKGRGSDNNGIRRKRLKVICKKGNVDEVGNYRPICTLSALYKLFSTIKHKRLYCRLEQAQSEDQGGFRRSHQTPDHLAKNRLLEQKCREWRIKMRVATVDFMMAFNSITQQMRYRITLHLPLEEAISGTERVSLNGQRKRHA